MYRRELRKTGRMFDQRQWKKTLNGKCCRSARWQDLGCSCHAGCGSNETTICEYIDGTISSIGRLHVVLIGQPPKMRKLEVAVEMHNDMNWDNIAVLVPSRTRKRVLIDGANTWTPE
jgi:hypothetical protein